MSQRPCDLERHAKGQPELKPGGGRLKPVNYMNPETELDKGNEWIEYFQKTFVQ